MADAHTALAAVRVEYEWDFEAARKGFERAIELNPSYPTARRWFAHYWSAVGRPELAVEEARRALELDPLSPVMNSALGRHLYHAGRYEEAIAQLRKAIELDPGLALARLHLGWTYEARGELGKAIPEYGRAVDLTARDPSMVAALARASAAAGRREEARRLLTELLHQSGRRYVSPCDIALVYAAMGDDGAAAEWMEKAGEERSGALVFLRRHPWTARLRALPRIAALLERLGLPG